MHNDKNVRNFRLSLRSEERLVAQISRCYSVKNWPVVFVVVPLRRFVNIQRSGVTETCKTDMTIKYWLMFATKFLIFWTWPRYGIYIMKNIGFRQPMHQFVSKFVLETKFVPLYWRLPIWRKYGDWMRQARPVHIVQTQFRPQ